MRTAGKIFLLLSMIFLFTGSLPVRLDYREGRYKNVCKDLRNDILLYFIFVDSRETSPWTEFDIMSTIDSMGVAIRWIEDQAEKHDIRLKIKTDYYIGNEFATVSRNLPGSNLGESLAEPNLKKGIAGLNKWADGISRKAGESFFIVEKDGIPKTQSPRDTERLIAHLRDEYKVESVALMFMLNNYFRDDISVALNTLITEEVEFAIVSYKYPAEIAHNLIHLYGGADLSLSPFRRSKRKAAKAKEFFPSGIMRDPYAKNIQNLEISSYTRYLIGWEEDIDPRYEPLLTDKVVGFF